MHDHVNCDHHKPASYGTAFAVGIALNSVFVVCEVFYGLASHSLSLVADAGHNLGDVLGLAMGWIATILAQRPPTPHLTYGYRRSSILAALGNSGLLLIGVGGVAWEAIQRLAHPVEVTGGTVMIVAGFGILVNGGTALMFLRGRKGEINVRSAYLHMLTDALVAAGVVVAGLAIRLLGHPWIDPVVSLLIAGLIAKASWSVLRESIDLALDAVPRSVDAAALLARLKGLPGVEDVCDFHVWAMSTSETAMTAHVVAPAGFPSGYLQDFEHELLHDFGVSHCTIQVEKVKGSGCALDAYV